MTVAPHGGGGGYFYKRGGGENSYGEKIRRGCCGYDPGELRNDVEPIQGICLQLRKRIGRGTIGDFKRRVHGYSDP